MLHSFSVIQKMSAAAAAIEETLQVTQGSTDRGFSPSSSFSKLYTPCTRAQVFSDWPVPQPPFSPRVGVTIHLQAAADPRSKLHG